MGLARIRGGPIEFVKYKWWHPYKNDAFVKLGRVPNPETGEIEQLVKFKSSFDRTPETIWHGRWFYNKRSTKFAGEPVLTIWCGYKEDLRAVPHRFRRGFQTPPRADAVGVGYASWRCTKLHLV